MNTTLQASILSTDQTYNYDFFLDHIEFCQSKGRGFSLFNADDCAIDCFSKQCDKKALNYSTIKFSAIDKNFSTFPAQAGFVVLIQDLPYDDFIKRVQIIADRLIFPLWFNHIPVCFFSFLNRDSYKDHVVLAENLHKDYALLVNSLLHEQIFTLLERVNYQFSSPDFINLSEHKTIFTPIEEIMRKALEDHSLTYQAQVRIGFYTVDFLVGIHNERVIVECDGKAYHDPDKDRERDKVLSTEGYPICRFSGADIYSNVNQCIEMIENALASKINPFYILDEDLDQSQENAVRSSNGPVRVLAPAGSGKTKTLVNRVLYLLNQGIPAEKILALAFNKKAQEEMQDRLNRKGVREVEIRTFHSLGYEIVKEGLDWKFNGQTHKKVRNGLMKEAIQQYTELPPRRNKDPLDAFLDGLRRAKMELPVLSTITVEFDERIYPFEEIFYSYLKKQLGVNFLDFDDMIYLAIRVLLDDRQLRRKYQLKFEFVLVDEFQDLNQAQLLLLQILSLPENNIFAVGDDDQMIYGFRGAEVKHIVEFDKRFPISTNHVLNTNYRSSQKIVRHSGWLISKNIDRVAKNIVPKLDAELGRFEVYGNASLLKQAEFAAKWLVAHKKDNDLNWRDYAILYRYNAFQFPLAVMLDTLDAPHSPLSGQHLFQSVVGRDIYSYLQVALSPSAALASDFDRILKRPNKYFTNQIISQASDWKSFLGLAETPGLREWEQEKIKDFILRIERLSDYTVAPWVSASNCLRMLKTEFGLMEFYSDQSKKSADLDYASDEIYLDVITALAENFKTVSEFFQYICQLIDDSDEKGTFQKHESFQPSKNEIYLSTIHKAKGKEFKNVIYFNLSKTDNHTKKDQLEEERRVAYVAATRPKDNLLITYSSVKPSIYLMELALNPKFTGRKNEAIVVDIASLQRRLEKEKVILRQYKTESKKATTRFDELSKVDEKKMPVWLLKVIWMFQNRRISRAQEKMEKLDVRLKTFIQNTCNPLWYAIKEAEDEVNMRKVLGLN